MKLRVCYIISEIDKALAFEWIASNINSQLIDLSFILLNPADSELEKFLKQNQVKVTRIVYTGKKDIPGAFIRLVWILRKEKIQIIHTHLFTASLIGLSAAYILGIKKRIHTRHNSTIHHDYFPGAVKYDRFINFLSTHIVAISDVVKTVLIEMEGVDPKKIIKIPHGFQFNEIPNANSLRIKKLKDKYIGQDEKYPVVGVISRYIHWKGIQYIIPAFKNLLLKYPQACLILANATGPYQAEISTLLSSLPTDSYIEIKFEKDIFALYKLFDVFVHVPIHPLSEAFGQIYIEALTSGIPTIATASGIAREVIKHEFNALSVEFKNSDSIYESIIRILEDPPLREKLIAQGKALREQFDLQLMIKSLESLYLE